MPELPEVEITRLALCEHILDRTITAVTVRNKQLRWPVPPLLGRKLPGERITAIDRRGKYLLFTSSAGCFIVHLGMSGSLCIVDAGRQAGKHDHVDIDFDDMVMRYNDPRRFGSFHWAGSQPLAHRLLQDLGPEPLSAGFDGDYLYQQSRKRKVAVKAFIMDHHTVVGVGNIYANEALFQAGIHPRRAAGRISVERYRLLAGAIKAVLRKAIAAGGTTLKDFVSGAHKPGYFQLQLAVYAREGLPCPRCRAPLRHTVLGQRASFYCINCQR